MRFPLILLAFLPPLSLAAQQQPIPSTGEAWRIVPQPQSSQVYARDGALVGEIGKEWRTSVSIRTLPKYVAQAFIAVEDKRFYQHDGVDVIGVLGALKDNVMGEHRGASTITQLLVGNMHPDVVDRRDKGLGRKLREQSAAREMEKHYNKEQILEAFLNQISFGHNWYGIESAARHYFGKPASRLSIAEAASLASLPKSPVGYDPAAHPENNRRRRNTVLALMAQQGFITPEQATAAEAEPVVTAPYAGMAAPAPYFVDVVRMQAERAGIPVSSGGYHIYTTVDVPLQRAAVEALAEGIAAVETRPGYKHPVPGKAGDAASSVPGSQLLQGAVIVIDPQTGDVRALVGGRDYARSPFDRAVNGLRQPGSSFKPFVYAAAVAESIPPNAIIPDTALAITLDNGTVYKPDNSDHQFLGPITLREALTKSRNPVAVQLGLQVGIDTIAALAHALGITSPIARYPSSAIGASAVRPLDLVAAYTGFANLGAAVEPRFVLRIDDRTSRSVWNARPSARDSALDPRVAFIVRDMMRDVVDRGTANPVRRYVPATVPVAGKTGTTNDNTDVWFVGMTPDLVGGVWLGFDTPKTITAGAAGGSLAAPIWGRMMATAGTPHAGASWTTPPDGIVTMEMDRTTGQPADLTTPNERRYTEYFLDGTQPGAPKVDVWRLFRVGPIGL